MAGEIDDETLIEVRHVCQLRRLAQGPKLITDS
jgi:hypothetical protein